MQIQISWLLQKPADLDLHCLQRHDIPMLRTRKVKTIARMTCYKVRSNTHFIFIFIVTYTYFRLPASVGQLDARPTRPGGSRFDPRRGRQHSFVEIDHEMFSTVILSLPLIQEGQLSVSDERMHTILVNCLED